MLYIKDETLPNRCLGVCPGICSGIYLDNCKNIIKNNFKLNKRLLLLLIPIQISILATIKELSNPNYIRYFVLNMSFIVFYNYPNLLLSIHKKPEYYDDLIIKTYLHEPMAAQESEKIEDKYKVLYQNIFKWSLLITSPIICALLTDVWFIKSNFATKDKESVKYLNPETVSALAIIFSLSSLYIKISILFGKILIKILKYFRNKSILKQITLSEIKINSEFSNFSKSHNLSRQSPRLSQSCIDLGGINSLENDEKLPRF